MSDIEERRDAFERKYAGQSIDPNTLKGDDMRAAMELCFEYLGDPEADDEFATLEPAEQEAQRVAYATWLQERNT